ncbi:MAG TPA: OmpA family protein [Steroidobacteraceae bacterium]|jgi:outer membrane protein OmpA-like peptidoglycan-associated protein|nr:OmpA family protein [Steroidobacteraceae bacterium]
MRPPDNADTGAIAVNTSTHVSPFGAARRSALPALAALAALAAMLLAACATTSPESASALAQAQSAVSTLEADPLAAQTAGKPLQDARDALAAALKAQHDHRPPDEVVHLAYLARRHAEIGEAVIAETRAHDRMADAQARRDQVLMAARERDAAAARAQASSAEAQAAAAQNQAAAARDQAAAANDQAAAARAQLADLQAKQTERGMVLTLGSNVLFDTGSDTLKPGADQALTRVAQFLQSQPGVKLRIEGHTDSRGSDSYNEALSQRRAQAVASALTDRGVDPSRLQAVGRGMQLPVATNETAEGRQQNRRVELIFSNQQGQFAGVG